MGNLLGLNRLNIQIPDAGIVRIVSGASVTIYNNNADGTAAVTAAGAVSGGAVLSTLYADRKKFATKSNPLTADAQGLVEFYVDKPEVHVLVTTPTGIVYGIPWYQVSTFDDSSLVLGYASIQDAIDALPTEGGVLHIPTGTYPGFNITRPAVSVIGEGDGTIITGSILISAGNVTLSDMTVRATGQTYGVKLFRTQGGGVPRCKLSNLFIGASFEGAGDGPQNGLWLDGAILTSVHNCTIAFCTLSGLFIDTTDVTWSTNVNSFYDCTFNGNTRYGVEVVGGSVNGVYIYGGNMEGNTIGELIATGMNGLRCIGVDFETSKTISNVINVVTSQPVIIEQCSFINVFGAADARRATRAILAQSASFINFVYNRISGYAIGHVARFDTQCVSCLATGNITVDGEDRFIEMYT